MMMWKERNLRRRHDIQYSIASTAKECTHIRHHLIHHAQRRSLWYTLVPCARLEETALTHGYLLRIEAA